MNDFQNKNNSGSFRPDGGQRLEEDFVRIMAERIKGMAKAATRRKERGKSVVDPTAEKRFWQVWEKAAEENGLDARAMRRLFAMLNDVAYAKSQGGPAWKSSALNLTPERTPEYIDLTGPADVRMTRLLTAAVAASGADAVVSPVVMNDALYELVQALAGAGSDLERQEEAVAARRGELAFGERTVFAGADELNLYMLLALMGPHAGRYTISGTGPAKAMDLSHVTEGFARLGVRLTSIEPQSKGLPVRLETPGIERAEIRLPLDFPADAALALAMAGPSYPEGMSMVWEPDWQGAGFLDEARAMFRILGVPAEEGQNSLNIPAGYRVSGTYAPDLDPVLSGYVLGWAPATGRRVRLAGRWPESAEAAAVAALLESAGLKVHISQEAVTAEPTGKGAGVLDATMGDELLPLAVALALGLEGGAKIKTGESFDRLAVEAMVDAFGAELMVEQGRIGVGGDKQPEDNHFLAPSEYHALGALTASPARPGTRLVNPGVLSDIWPGIIKIYRTLFRAPEAGPKGKDADGRSSKGRRIRL